MAREMASEDEKAFARFRVKFESAARVERFRLWTSWRSATARVREARDTYVQLAFDTLVAQWGHNAPFAAIDYAEFVRRIRGVIERYGELGWPERLVLRAWTRPPSPGAYEAKPKMLPGFKPVFARRTRDDTSHSSFLKQASPR